MIIGIAGRAQHGKDTIGKVLVEHYDYRRVAFADKVRELAMYIDPAITHGVTISPLGNIVRARGWDYAKTIPQVRKFLQNLGEGARQVLSSGTWIFALFSHIDGLPDNFVITDVRYQNEVAAIRNRGGKVWRVTRPGFDNGVDPEHPSEANVALLDVDVDICNDGTVEELAAKVMRLMGGDHDWNSNW